MYHYIDIRASWVFYTRWFYRARSPPQYYSQILKVCDSCLRIYNFLWDSCLNLGICDPYWFCLMWHTINIYNSFYDGRKLWMLTDYQHVNFLLKPSLKMSDLLMKNRSNAINQFIELDWGGGEIKCPTFSLAQPLFGNSTAASSGARCASDSLQLRPTFLGCIAWAATCIMALSAVRN